MTHLQIPTVTARESWRGKIQNATADPLASLHVLHTRRDGCEDSCMLVCSRLETTPNPAPPRYDNTKASIERLHLVARRRAEGSMRQMGGQRVLKNMVMWLS